MHLAWEECFEKSQSCASVLISGVFGVFFLNLLLLLLLLCCFLLVFVCFYLGFLSLFCFGFVGFFKKKLTKKKKNHFYLCFLLE